MNSQRSAILAFRRMGMLTLSSVSENGFPLHCHRCCGRLLRRDEKRQYFHAQSVTTTASNKTEITTRLLVENQRRFMQCQPKRQIGTMTAIKEPLVNPPGRPGQNLDQLVFQLKMDIRRVNRVRLSDLNAVIDLLAKGIRSEEHLPFLLSCCGSVLPDVKIEKRNELVDRLWSMIINRNNGRTTVENFEALLKVHTENSQTSVDPFLILQKMQSSSLKLTEDVYYYSLLLFCQRGNIEATAKLLTLMKADNMIVGGKHFNALILGNGRAGDLNAAKEIIKIMQSNHLNPSGETYTVLLQTLIEAEQLQDLKTTFEMAKEKCTFLDNSLFKLLKVAAETKNSSIFDLVLEWRPHAHVNYLSVVNTVKEIIYCGETLAALKVVKKFSDTLKLQGDHVGDFFIRDSIFANDDPAVVLYVCSCLVDEGFNKFAFNIATDCSYRHKRFDLALDLLKEMSKRGLEIRPHYFLPLIVHQFNSTRIEGLVEAIERMRELNVPLDWNTLYDWIVPRLLEAEISPLEAARILKTSSNSTYSAGILSAILACLLRQKRIQEASVLVKKLKGTVKKPELLLQHLSKAILEVEQRANLKENLLMSIGILQYIKDNIPSDDKNDYIGTFLLRISGSIAAVPKLWEKFLKDLAEANVTISEGALQNIQSNSSEHFSLKMDLDLNDNRNRGGMMMMSHHDMDIASLECLVEELASKSLNTRGALRRLFLKYCQKDELQKALEVKSKFEKDSTTLSDGMKSALLGLYIRHKLLEPAMAIYINLKESPNNFGEAVDIDFYKILDLASLLLENSLMEDAVSLIEKECLDCPPPLNPKSVTRNVVNFLEALAKAELNNKLSAKHTRLKPIVDLLLEKSMAEAKGPVIGVLIQSYIVRGEIETAVAEFSFYSQRYKITPGRQQLIYAVLRRPDLLKEVYASSVAVRGEIDSKHHIAFAKSDMGDLDGAAKMLSNLGKDVQFIRILKQCEFLGSRREVTKILNLAKALKMSDKNVDCSKIYNIALLSGKRYRDIEGFRRVVTVMQEEDLYIVPDLLRYVKTGF